MKFKVKWNYAVMIHEDHVVDLTDENPERLLEEAMDAGYETVAEWVAGEPISFVDADTRVHRQEGDCVGDYDVYEVEEMGVLDQIVEATEG